MSANGRDNRRCQANRYAARRAESYEVRLNNSLHPVKRYDGEGKLIEVVSVDAILKRERSKR